MYTFSLFHIILTCSGPVQLNSINAAATDREESQDFDLPLLDFVQIANATDNFSYSNKLGEGGFGAVYKVTMLIHNLCIPYFVVCDNLHCGTKAPN